MVNLKLPRSLDVKCTSSLRLGRTHPLEKPIFALSKWQVPYPLLAAALLLPLIPLAILTAVTLDTALACCGQTLLKITIRLTVLLAITPGQVLTQGALVGSTNCSRMILPIIIDLLIG